MPACYLNGEIIPVHDAKIGVYDIGILRGFGIYEALTTFNRKPFELDAHLDRFEKSARSLTLTIPLAREKIAEVLKELIARNIPDGKEAVIRILLTGGEAVGGIEIGEKPTFYILVEPLIPIQSRYYSEGASLIAQEFPRQFPQMKTTNYIQAVLLQKARKESGAIEILYTNRGNVLECATSNFFIVADGALVTAKDDVLLGITRKVTLELAAKNNIQTEERDVTEAEMYAADEAFITSSFKGIVPVVQIAGKKIGSGKVGSVTKQLMRALDEYTRTY